MQIYRKTNIRYKVIQTLCPAHLWVWVYRYFIFLYCDQAEMGLGFPTGIMPEQELPFVHYRCRYLERYYNQMVNEKEAAKKGC